MELKARLDRSDRLVVLDVREPQEYQINRIDGSVLIPLGELGQRYGELDPSVEIVAQCKSGARSAKAADFLREKGYRVKNLKGGILDWIDKVDPSQPKVLTQQLTGGGRPRRRAQRLPHRALHPATSDVRPVWP